MNLSSEPSGGDPPKPDSESATELLVAGQALQRDGMLDAATLCFARAADAAGTREPTLQAEAWRRLGIVHHLRGEREAAAEYCARSLQVARTVPGSTTVIEAMMVLANIATEEGRIEEAKAQYVAALDRAGDDPELAARITQNLGIAETILGNLADAQAHHQQAMATYQRLGDSLGCARSHHNLGMIHADRGDWAAAIEAYRRAATLAAGANDRYLEALCFLNQAEAELAQGIHREAKHRAEAALARFEQVGARLDQADAYRVLGMAHRQLSQQALAETHLRSALDIATSAGAPLVEAETCRELATFYAEAGQPSQAVSFFDRALGLFRRVGAERDWAVVSGMRLAEARDY